MSLNNAENVGIIWWMPKEFWLAAGGGNGQTDVATNLLLGKLSEYNIFGVVSGESGFLGAINYNTAEEIKDSLFLYTDDGTKLFPLSDKEINSETVMVLEIFKPMIKNMLGNFGENFHFFVFEGTLNGKRLYDPTKEGLLKAELLGSQYKWRLPLGSLMPPKYCPNCDSKMEGNWKYCPYDGKKLKVKK